jgi:hypothetical protein
MAWVRVGGILQTEATLIDTTGIHGGPDRTYNPCVAERKRPQNQRITGTRL